MTCINCLRGAHFSCYGGACKCTHSLTEYIPDAKEKGEVEGNEEHQFKWQKEESKIKDEFSTGRKRAARLYPLDRSAPCEWRDKESAGGGAHPIKGCSNGKQRNRHHGPDKNTLNNEIGNVHRICTSCHNRWHQANDKSYAIEQLETMGHD